MYTRPDAHGFFFAVHVANIDIRFQQPDDSRVKFIWETRTRARRYVECRDMYMYMCAISGCALCGEFRLRENTTILLLCMLNYHNTGI